MAFNSPTAFSDNFSPDNEAGLYFFVYRDMAWMDNSFSTKTSIPSTIITSFVSICKPHIFKFNFTTKLLEFYRIFWLFYKNFGVKKFKNSFSRSHRCLKDIVLLRQISHRSEKHLRILKEWNQNTYRYGPLYNLSTTIPDYKPNSNCTDQFNRWEKNCIIKNWLYIGMVVERL